MMSMPLKVRTLVRVLAFTCALPVLAVTVPADRAAFYDSVKEVAVSPTTASRVAVSRLALKPDESAASLPFEVALRMRNFDELQARIAKGEQISRSEMAAKYYPTAEDHAKLVQWLTAQGFEITRTDDDRLAVFVKAPISTTAQALQVTFARVIGKDGGEYTSAITAPSLPGDISPIVLGFHGLQPHIKLHPLAIHTAPIPGTNTAKVQINLGGYLPSQIQAAYNATGLTIDGNGQTIAIFALGYPLTSDLEAFWTAAGIPNEIANITRVNVAGGPAASTDSLTLEEAALDTEWASTLAPGAAVRIYAASEDDPGENDEILQQVFADTATIPSIHQLCICIGSNEQEIEKDYLIIEAQYMANLASAGVSVLVASGDNGAEVDNVLQVTTPTSDPDVTGVGGTSLTLSGSTVSMETGWSGSGGGASVVFSRPPWQTGTGVPAGATRLVPDVAATADNNLGGEIVFNGQTVVVGGTSWATPIWTAFTALLNTGRSTPLGLLNPRLYPLLGTTSFRDITSGSNGYYSAGVGYDQVTGIGVPDMTALLTATLGPASTINVPAQLGNVFTTVGQPATFFIVAEGATSPTYSWQRLPFGSSTWATLSDGTGFTGTSTSALVVQDATLSMTGDGYRCVVTDSAGSVTSTPPGTITVSQTGTTTFAGWPGSAGSQNGTGWAARFAYPGSVRADSAGNLYIADSYNDTVRKVTPGGVTTLVAGTPATSGSTDGPAASALFNGTAGVAVDGLGNLYVADNGNHEIRMISTSGIVSTLAGSASNKGVVDGTGSSASFYDPQNLAIDSAGNLYVADGAGNVIRKVTPAGVVTTFAGAGISGGPGTAGSADGQGAAAEFNDPTGIAVDPQGNVYVADAGNQTIRVITPAGVVSTLAGSPGNQGSADGTGSAARFADPAGVGVDAAGNVYVADNGNDTIRKVSPAGVVTTIAGVPGDSENIDGTAANSRLSGPGDVTIDSTGVIYVADSLNQTIRRIIAGPATAPTVSVQPVTQTVNVGANVVLSVGVEGEAPFTYQWFFDGGVIIGANGPSYVISDAQTSDGGSYSVTVTNSMGAVQTTAATLTVATPAGYPQILTQPTGGTLASGGSVTLSVSATGNAPLSYQWYLNDAPISGATSTSYAATSIGSYTVAVANALASVLSDEAVVGSGSRLIDISSRGFVGTGGGIAIAGIHIEGPSSEYKQLLVRGVGPALSQFLGNGTLATPTVAVYDSSGAVIVSNTGWGNAPVAGSSTSKATFTPATSALMSSLGAFTIGSADSALVVNLPPGNYTAELSGVGSTTGVGLVEVYETNTSDPAVLTDISTRAQVGTGADILIAGFVVSGTEPATILVRGIGPAIGLAPFNVSGVLAKPIVSVYDSSGLVIASNTGWSNAPVAGTSSVSATFRAATSADMASAGAFALTAGSLDSAIVITLPPGNYSAEITGVGGTSGVALAEIYQLEP